MTEKRGSDDTFDPFGSKRTKRDIETIEKCINTPLTRTKTETIEVEEANTQEDYNRTSPALNEDIVNKHVVELVENRFQCTICKELFIKTVSLNCGHSYCSLCIKRWKRRTRKCPQCRAWITHQAGAIVLDNFIEEIVNKSTVERKRARQEVVENRKSEEVKFDEENDDYESDEYTPFVGNDDSENDSDSDESVIPEIGSDDESTVQYESSVESFDEEADSASEHSHIELTETHSEVQSLCNVMTGSLQEFSAYKSDLNRVWKELKRASVDLDNVSSDLDPDRDDDLFALGFDLVRTSASLCQASMLIDVASTACATTITQLSPLQNELTEVDTRLQEIISEFSSGSSICSLSLARARSIIEPKVTTMGEVGKKLQKLNEDLVRRKSEFDQISIEFYHFNNIFNRKYTGSALDDSEMGQVKSALDRTVGEMELGRSSLEKILSKMDEIKIKLDETSAELNKARQEDDESNV